MLAEGQFTGRGSQYDGGVFVLAPSADLARPGGSVTGLTCAGERKELAGTPVSLIRPSWRGTPSVDCVGSSLFSD